MRTYLNRNQKIKRKVQIKKKIKKFQFSFILLKKLKTYKELDEEANMTFQPKLIAVRSIKFKIKKHNKYLGERDISFIERNKLWQDELK